MPNGNGKAFSWSCADASDGELTVGQLAARFRTEDDAKVFTAGFEAAQVYNKAAKEGGELVVAPEVEDIEEVPVDDIDTNKTADPDGGEEAQ